MKRFLPWLIGTALLLAVSTRAYDVCELIWNASPSTDLVTGYNIYGGTNSGQYTWSINCGDSLEITLTNLVPGSTNFFVVTAYDAQGDQSDFSNEAEFIAPYLTPPALGTATRVLLVTIYASGSVTGPFTNFTRLGCEITNAVGSAFFTNGPLQIQ